MHITYDTDGDLVIQSGHSRYGTLDAIAANSTGIWVLHNPEQTNLLSMEVFTDWFLHHFKSCKRFFESEFSIVDYYVKNSIPCNLITEDEPLAISYDNGMELANTVSEQTNNELIVYLWWRHTIGSVYSLSLQIFDESRSKVRQLDAVIEGEPIDVFTFDLSGLSPGNYTIELIVYEFEAKASQPGHIHIVHSQEPFERTVVIARISLDDRA